MVIGEASPNTLEARSRHQRMLSVDSTAKAAIFFPSPNIEKDSAPRNPEGRVGIAGKGLLPQFGGNPACFVIVERCCSGSFKEVLLLRGARAGAQFPWVCAILNKLRYPAFLRQLHDRHIFHLTSSSAIMRKIVPKFLVTKSLFELSAISWSVTN